MKVEEMGYPTKLDGPPMIKAAARVLEKKKGAVPVRGRGRIKRLICESIVGKVKALMARCAARFIPRHDDEAA